MKMMFRTCLGLGIVTMLVGPAMAQGRYVFGRPVSLGMLLGNASVQKELKLDDPQIEKAKEVAQTESEKLREMGETLRGLEGEERVTKMREITKQVHESTLKSAEVFLKPEQVTRLKQIYYQRQGIKAFDDPEVAKKLNLTDNQKSDIEEIARETYEKEASSAALRHDGDGATKKTTGSNKEAARQGPRQAERRATEGLEGTERRAVRVAASPLNSRQPGVDPGHRSGREVWRIYHADRERG